MSQNTHHPAAVRQSNQPTSAGPAYGQMQPSSVTITPEGRRSLLIRSLLEHHWTPDRDDDVEREISRDWLEAVAPFDPEIVARAKKDWLHTHSTKPTIKEFLVLCRDWQRRAEIATRKMLEAPRPLPTNWYELKRYVSFQRWQPPYPGRRAADVLTAIQSAVGDQIAQLRTGDRDITVAEALTRLSNTTAAE